MGCGPASTAFGEGTICLSLLRFCGSVCFSWEFPWRRWDLSFDVASFVEFMPGIYCAAPIVTVNVVCYSKWL